jgi:phage terminase large subunit-like protein
MGYSLEKTKLEEFYNTAKNDVTVQSKIFTKNFNFPGLGGDLLFGADHMDYPNIESETMFKAKGIVDNTEFYGYKVEELEHTDRDKAKRMIQTYYERPKVFVGFDGAYGNNDLSVVTFLVVIDGIYYIKQKTFLLKKSINERIQKDGVDYNKYVESGELILLEGDSIIAEDIIEYIDSTIKKDYSVVGKMGIDPYGEAEKIIRYYKEKYKYDDPKIAIPMSNAARFRKYTTPIIYNLKNMFENKKIHSNSQILKMCMANCELKEYGVDGTVSIIKIGEDPRLRIDAVWSLIYAIKAYKMYELDRIGGE